MKWKGDWTYGNPHSRNSGKQGTLEVSAISYEEARRAIRKKAAEQLLGTDHMEEWFVVSNLHEVIAA